MYEQLKVQFRSKDMFSSLFINLKDRHNSVIDKSNLVERYFILSEYCNNEVQFYLAVFSRYYMSFINQFRS